MPKISAEEKHKIYSQPLNEQFTQADDDKEVNVHILKDKSEFDYNRVVNAGKLFKSEGKVWVMPEICEKETEVRQRFGIPVPKGNPDLKVGNMWIDVKSPLSVSNLGANANDAFDKQGAFACITDDCCVIDESKLDYYAKGLFCFRGYKGDILFFIVNNKLYKYNRQDFE